MITKHILSNGITVVMERIPHFRSASVGVWIKTGSIHEDSNENGLSHFIEHMIFKSTNKRSAREIAETMAAVGGQINAFTAREYTCLYSRILDEHLELSLDLISDMLLNSRFDVVEFEKEKKVI